MTKTADKRLTHLKYSAESISERLIGIRESYYLNNWHRYKRDIGNLKESELKKLKELYKALKELPAEDREFLAMKYDRQTIKLNDAVVADELGMDLEDYRTKRRLIQKKLKIIMKLHRLEELNNDKTTD